MNKGKRYMSLAGTFYSYWASRKSQRPKGGGGRGGGTYKNMFFKKSPGVIRNV